MNAPKKRNRTKIGLSWAFGFTLLLAACNLPRPAEQAQATPLPIPVETPTQSPSPAAPEPTATPSVIQGTISIWHSWSEGDRLALEAIIQAFSAAHPNVYFDILYVPSSDLPRRYAQAVREGGGPTLLFGPAGWARDLLAQGAVADLGALVSADLLETLNVRLLPTTLIGDTLTGLPYAQQGVVLYRNREISTLAPETLDELVLLAQSATQGETIGAMLERGFPYAGAHLLGLGGQWMDAGGFPAFNQEAGQQWLELLKTFEQAGPPNYLTDQDLELFKQGRLGWIIDGTWNLFDLARSLGANRLAIDPWPRHQSGHLAGFLRSEAIFFNPRAPGVSVAAALVFSEFFLSQPAQAILAQTERIPAATQIEVGTTLTDTLISQAMLALAGDFAQPDHPAWELYTLNLEQALQEYYAGDLSAPDSLRLAEAAIQAAWQERLALTPTLPITTTSATPIP